MHPASWLGIAFLRGSRDSMYDSLVMDATQGPWVHSEVLLARGSQVRAYSAFSSVGGFVPSPSLHCGPEWAIVRFPLAADGGYERAYAVILQILSSSLPYNYCDLWQCCIGLLLPLEADLDCHAPSTWTRGVYCSQVSLLILRRLIRSGLVPASGVLRSRVDAVNSRGCSPNKLYRLLCGWI